MSHEYFFCLTIFVELKGCPWNGGKGRVEEDISSELDVSCMLMV